MKTSSRFLLMAGFLLAVTLAAAAPATAQPAFSKAFVPGSIGPGSVTTLTFTISNESSASAVRSLAFTDALPAGVVIAAAPRATSSCSGSVVAPAGGSTIAFSAERLAAFSRCTVSVNVTSSTPGTHTNVTGDLTSSAGNSGSATANLVVETTRPGFSKTFAPNVVGFGGRSTLTFTIDNTANANALFNVSFTDTFPAGLTVADPANAGTACGGTATAAPGSTVVALFASMVPAGSACSISADVVAGAVGELTNTSGELQFSSVGASGSAGKAAASLSVPVQRLTLAKSFLDDPVQPGRSATLQLTVSNRDRGDAATGIAFTDDLDATLAGLQAVGTPIADPCGAGSQLTGTSMLTLTGGTLAPQGTCTFAVSVLVPPVSPGGVFPNTTSAVSGLIGGEAVVGSAGSDSLTVAPVPGFAKRFLTNPVAAGGSSPLEYTITNSSATASVTSIGFTDELGVAISGVVPTLPASGFCGAGSVAFWETSAGRLNVSGATLAPGASCSFQVVLAISSGLSPRLFPSVTSALAATVDGVPLAADPASDELVVVAAPRLRKQLSPSVVSPGGTVSMQLTLELGEGAPGPATGIAFTDDLDAALAGLVATGLPASDVCGAGSQLAGTGLLSLSGGTLAPGEACTFAVTLQVPSAAPGSYTNTTSGVTATMLEIAVTSPAASDVLQVGTVTLAKAFVDDPVAAGAPATLRFTVSNPSPAMTATGITFTDDLAATLVGLVATGLPATDVCGAGSQLSGTSVLTLTGGTLPPSGTCAFDVSLAVPAGAQAGEFANRTSAVSAVLDGAAVSGAAASDTLLVLVPLSLTKAFERSPVPPGGTVQLEFTIGNTHPAAAASGIAFSDDLDAGLPGMAATGLPAAACGGTVSGTDVVTFSGGALAAASSCTFAVTVQVPAAAPIESTVTNVTSAVTGTVGGTPVTGSPATSWLQVDHVRFAKSFPEETCAGCTTSISFTLTNVDAAAGVTGLTFTDDLDAVVPGLVASGLPALDVCGAGSVLSGSSVITLSNGSLGPSASCTFAVQLPVPAGTADGVYVNATSDLLSEGRVVAYPARDQLFVGVPRAIPSLTGWRIGLLAGLVALLGLLMLARTRGQG